MCFFPTHIAMWGAYFSCSILRPPSPHPPPPHPPPPPPPPPSSTQHHQHNTINTTSSTQHHQHNITKHTTINTTSSTQHHQHYITNTTQSCVAGAALGGPHVRFARQAQHLDIFTEVRRRPATSDAFERRLVFRGSRRTWSTSGSFCVAGAGHGAPSQRSADVRRRLIRLGAASFCMEGAALGASPARFGTWNTSGSFSA